MIGAVHALREGFSCSVYSKRRGIGFIVTCMCRFLLEGFTNCWNACEQPVFSGVPMYLPLAGSSHSLPGDCASLDILLLILLGVASRLCSP